METTKSTKRLVTKPIEEKFVPPVAEVIEEEVKKMEPVAKEAMSKVEAPKEVPVEIIPPVAQESKPTQIKWGLFYGGLLLVVLVVGFSGGLWWAYRTGVGIVTPSPTPALQVQATPTPTPIPVVVNKSAVTVDVLNASGKTGFAGKIADQVKELEYQVGTIGNATSQTMTTLELTEDLASVSAIILADMQRVVSATSLVDKPLVGASKTRLVLGSEE